MRRARIDSNHREIRQALLACGWLVHDVHRLPGWIDFTAYHPARQQYALIDAKSPKGRLTEAQNALIQAGWPIAFLRSVDDALAL